MSKPSYWQILQESDKPNMFSLSNLNELSYLLEEPVLCVVHQWFPCPSSSGLIQNTRVGGVWCQGNYSPVSSLCDCLWIISFLEKNTLSVQPSLYIFHFDFLVLLCSLISLGSRGSNRRGIPLYLFCLHLPCLIFVNNSLYHSNWSVPPASLWLLEWDNIWF